VLTISDQFPGPTIEARSSDMLEIEVFNFSEDEISLHWHGLYMRGEFETFIINKCHVNLNGRGK
jgi:FtsP/CotA-like multicopper oxidase with cupredoxin domain